jgi:hypothetical protein
VAGSVTTSHSLEADNGREGTDRFFRDAADRLLTADGDSLALLLLLLGLDIAPVESVAALLRCSGGLLAVATRCKCDAVGIIAGETLRAPLPQTPRGAVGVCGRRPSLLRVLSSAVVVVAAVHDDTVGVVTDFPSRFPLPPPLQSSDRGRDRSDGLPPIMARRMPSAAATGRASSGLFLLLVVLLVPVPVPVLPCMHIAIAKLFSAIARATSASVAFSLYQVSASSCCRVKSASRGSGRGVVDALGGDARGRQKKASGDGRAGNSLKGDGAVAGGGRGGDVLLPLSHAMYMLASAATALALVSALPLP